MLDDDLYLLNTTSLKWTVAAPVGPKPSGRYGHTISTIGSMLYIFGGQLDDTFFDDLACYDLTTLQSPTSSWNFVKPASVSPPPRTNHTIITYQDKLYLFGGTDGKLWYSDTWVYDPVDNTWAPLECAGFIPAPCEGHSATIVGDTMYVFGGRSAEGKDLGALSALKIPAKKWFSFQNMGPGPTPRSGHSMTAFAGNKILIMGGESPDLDQQNAGSDGNADANNVVYVLETSRISYPSNANEPDKTRASAPQTNGVLPANTPDAVPTPAVSAANVSPTATQPLVIRSVENLKPRESDNLKALRTDSSLSELTPGYGYERVNVGDPEKDDTSTSEDESPSYYKPDKSDTPVTNPESSPSDMSKPDGTESPFSIDTVRAASTSPSNEKGTPGVENLQQALEQLKASNSWYETELAAAREKGFIPSTNPPVDVLKMRRVSQRITMDTDQSLNERAILVEALSDLKEELHEVQQNVQNQAEQASAKIAEAEADRDDAFERLKLSEAQLMAAKNGPRSLNEFDDKDALIASLKAQLEERDKTRTMFFGSHANNADYNPAVELEKIRSDNINLEQQLRTFSDKNILAQHESSRIKTQLEDLTQRYRTLEESTDVHVKSLTAASLAITAAQTKSSEYSNLLAIRNNERTAMQSELNGLRGELDTVKQQLSDSQEQLEEHKLLLSRSTEQGATSSAALCDGIDRLVTMWAGSKLFKKVEQKAEQKNKRMSMRSRDFDAEPLAELEQEDDDPEIAMLKKQLKEVTQLYETHQKASQEATRDLSITLQQVSSLKQELVNTESSRQSASDQLQKALRDLREVRNELETHQTQLHENKRSLDTFAESAKQQTDEKDDLVVDLHKRIEETEERYITLENEYESSMQYVRTSEKALTKTRDELNRVKDINTKLQGEIDQLRLRLQDQEENDDTSSVTSSNTGGVRSRSDHRVGTPPTKYNSRQIDLQLRDLRAQIIILQEERDELRASTLEAKKKFINNNEDLKDAQAMIEQLERENDDLMKRVELAEAAMNKTTNGGSSSVGGHASHGSYSPDDPDKTLDSLTSELDQIRNERERLSGLLHT